MKKRTMAAVLALVFGLLLGLSFTAAAQEGAGAPGTYSGYLFCKLDNIGTKSEGGATISSSGTTARFISSRTESYGRATPSWTST